MYERDYKDWVLADYDNKLKARLLPPALVAPTPAGLKAETAKACELRFNKKDEALLRSFFNQKESQAAYCSAIHNCSADLFRPLTSFLRDRAIKTAHRNIELLAWLIDFQHRPFDRDLERIPEPQVSAIEMKGEKPVRNEKPIMEQGKLNEPVITKNTNKLWLALPLLAVLVFGGYLIYYYAGQQTTEGKGCMIWSDDHYEPVNCGAKSPSGPSYPINLALVKNLRRITKPDTLTPHSIRKVWYVKYNGRVEFFNMDAPYPPDTNRRMLPMTDHILDKYVYHVTN